MKKADPVKHRSSSLTNRLLDLYWLHYITKQYCGFYYYEWTSQHTLQHTCILVWCCPHLRIFAKGWMAHAYMVNSTGKLHIHTVQVQINGIYHCLLWSPPDLCFFHYCFYQCYLYYSNYLLPLLPLLLMQRSKVTEITRVMFSRLRDFNTIISSKNKAISTFFIFFTPTILSSPVCSFSSSSLYLPLNTLCNNAKYQQQCQQ